jgi:hypothetical protein
MAKKKVSNDEIAEMGAADAGKAYIESGSTETPDGGWDSWLINGIGVAETLKRFGEPESENAEGWSPVMALKLQTYHKAACEAMAELDQDEHMDLRECPAEMLWD